MKHALFVLDLISSRMDLFAERDNPSFSSVLFDPLLFDNLRHCNDEREERCINPPRRYPLFASYISRRFRSSEGCATSW